MSNVRQYGMASEKRLSSVCHSIAHHAVSGLSYVHPHLRQACRMADENSVLIDLCNSNPYPENLRTNQPLEQALLSLQSRFFEILKAEGFTPNDIQAAKLFFEFNPEFPADYCCNCHATLISATGKQFAHAVNYNGASNLLNPSIKRDALKRAPYVKR